MSWESGTCMLSESAELVLMLSQMNTQTVLYTFPGLGFLICLRLPERKSDEWSQSLYALSALGPKAPKEAGIKRAKRSQGARCSAMTWRGGMGCGREVQEEG